MPVNDDAINNEQVFCVFKSKNCKNLIRIHGWLLLSQTKLKFEFMYSTRVCFHYCQGKKYMTVFDCVVVTVIICRLQSSTYMNLDSGCVVPGGL